MTHLSNTCECLSVSLACHFNLQLMTLLDGLVKCEQESALKP